MFRSYLGKASVTRGVSNMRPSIIALLNGNAASDPYRLGWVLITTQSTQNTGLSARRMDAKARTLSLLRVQELDPQLFFTCKWQVWDESMNTKDMFELSSRVFLRFLIFIILSSLFVSILGSKTWRRTVLRATSPKYLTRWKRLGWLPKCFVPPKCQSYLSFK